MNEQTRYRITGSLFVIALAIIFLPMLFDGAGVRDMELRIEQTVPSSTVKPPPASVRADSFAPKAFAKAESLESKIAQRQKTARIGEVVISQASPLGDNSGSVTSWGVQLGSFSSAENARKLKIQLEKSEYNVVLSRASNSGSTITRVAIGPLIQESDAIELRKQLSRTYREAIVVKLGY